MNTHSPSTSRGTSTRTRLIAAAIIFAGMTGSALAFTPAASASTVTAAAADPTVPVSHAPASVQVKDAGIATVLLVNSTPYEWTLDPSSNQGGPGHPTWGPGTIGPQQKLEPGQQESITTGWDGSEYTPMYVQYNFTDVNGGDHVAAFQTGSGAADWAGHVVLNAADNSNGGSVPSGVFHINRNNQGTSVVFQAILNQPAEVTVDANAHPAQAQAIMTQFSSAQPGSQSFTPQMVTGSNGQQIPDVTYTTGAAEKITGEVINETDRLVTVTSTHEVDQSQSTTLGLTVGVESNINILNVVNSSAALKATMSKSWGVTTGFSQSASLVLNPLNSPSQTAGWITRKASIANVTGDFGFISADGIVYHVENVTVSEEQIDGASTPDGAPTTTIYGQEWTN